MVMQGINWGKVKRLSELSEQVSGDELYDDSPEDADVYSARIQPGLTEEERRDAEWWSPFSQGVWRIIAGKGEGKTAFCIHICELFRRYFGRTVILNYKPRRLFGKYVPFSLPMFINQLDRIKYQTTVKANINITTDEEYQERIQAECLAGDIFLTDSIWHLDEFDQYMPRRNPNSPISNTFADWFTVERHYDTLIMGSCTKLADLETRRLEAEVTADVFPRWDYVNGCVMAKFIPLRYVSSLGRLKIKKRPRLIKVDIFKKRDYLNGYAIKDLYNTKNLQAITVRKSIRKDIKRGDF